MSIAEGQPAPDFTLTTDAGAISLADLKGKPFVLYFYPKDDTPGCTKEACGFSDSLPDFSALGIPVIGVSKDSVASHTKFRAKYDLKITLGSDESGAVCEAFGAWVEKSMYGKKYMGIDRATFVVDAQGIIRHVWRKVSVTGHVEKVLEAVKTL